MSTPPLTEPDADTLRAKYRAERAKRLRADGNAQYRRAEDGFAHYLRDAYAPPATPRAPLFDDVDVVIIGGGFGGLLAGARLRQAGVRDLRMIEQGADFGGTWYWNRYPGAACDIESYIYLPLLEETGYMPVEKYSRAPEIFEHSKRIARHFDLYENACLQTTVTALRWDGAAARWIVQTDRGDAMRARFVVMSNGPLNRPKLPGIAGIEGFRGHAFHTSRWDYAYTGGDVTGGLDKLADKRVGIIGTGATAVQCVPHLAAGAKHLYVFQRTPSSIDVRANKPTDPDWVSGLKPGWQIERMENFNTLVSGGFAGEDLVADGWTDIIRNLIFIAQKEENKGLSPAKLMALAERADFLKMEQVRGRVDAVVARAEVAASLKPWYRQFCKRPCFHDEYLQAFNRDNVTLVDTDGRGVDRITATAVVANGVAHEVDCLIYATGFEVGTGILRRTGYKIYGRDGVSLDDAWAEGARSLHGIHIHGFPNLFTLGGPQGGFTANYPHNLNEQAVHVTHILSHAMAAQARCVEATPEAEAAWVQRVIETAFFSEQYQKECTPGYYNNEGQPEKTSRRNGPFGGSVAYFGILADWRKNGGFEGLVVA
jgi:cyclohexanone monooxygenase